MKQGERRRGRHGCRELSQLLSHFCGPAAKSRWRTCEVEAALNDVGAHDHKHLLHHVCKE